jgi:hypothetical protein
MPTAETTLIPATGTNQRAAKKSLTSNARLYNEPIWSGSGWLLEIDGRHTDPCSHTVKLDLSLEAGKRAARLNRHCVPVFSASQALIRD